MGESGRWTVEMTSRYSFDYGDYCTADDLEAIAATRGLGNMIAERQGDAVKQAFLESVRTQGFSAWNQLMLFGVNTPYFGTGRGEKKKPEPEWVRKMDRNVNRPEACGLQTDEAFFDTIKDRFVPLLHTLLNDGQTREKMYRATNRGWLALLPDKLQELEETTKDMTGLYALMHNQIVACNAVLRCYPPPSVDEAQQVCSYCWETKTPMFRCTGACGGSAHYCCRQHQKADWKRGHKRECKEQKKSEPAEESASPREPIRIDEDGNVDVKLTAKQMNKIFGVIPNPKPT